MKVIVVKIIACEYASHHGVFSLAFMFACNSSYLFPAASESLPTSPPPKTPAPAPWQLELKGRKRRSILKSQSSEEKPAVVPSEKDTAPTTTTGETIIIQKGRWWECYVGVGTL